MCKDVDLSSVGFLEESAFQRLLGDFIDPAPLIQVTGVATREWQNHVERYLSSNRVPFGVLDCAAFAECRSNNPSALMHWLWSRFSKKLVSGVCSTFPREAVRVGRLKNLELHNSTDLVRLIHSLTLSDPDGTRDTTVNCMVILVQDYQELLIYEPSLLNTLLRLHEKISRMHDPNIQFTKKVMVVLMGSYPLPPEAAKGDFAIPVIQLKALDQQSRAERILADNAAYATSMASEIVPGISTDTAEYLWDGFVRYFVGVVYSWYKTDCVSMEFYCRILWKIFLEPLRGSSLPDETQLEECLHHLCKSVDMHVHNLIVHYQSRFISDLYDSSVSHSVIAHKQLDKFHGSRLAKYLILGAAISTMTKPDQIRRRIRQQKIRDLGTDNKVWHRRRKFDFWTWIANTEWVMTSNESEKLTLDHILFGQVLWVISEGYVKPLSNIGLWRRLPSSRGAALWRVSDILPSADLSWRDSTCHHNNTEISAYLGQILGTSARFVLCATKDLILSSVKDLNIDVQQYLF
ncbi:origin recognition complex subunit, putative [Babesia ovis]|uniref:Origin recognition complex subunit, putative n=1 Tax=Babesia ovis TaxID=5869 RepID=A0A9W5WWK4_BABOV|nr:origin recognition complex subunit, putative [Babesia ovis]